MMITEFTETWMFTLLQILSIFFIAVVGFTVLVVIVLYFIDISQTKHTIRRNYPVFGRFRYLFEHIGEFFRQYFFAMDREELPFNRAERSWAYQAAKNVDSTIAFGSTRDLRPEGSVFFVNCPYPTLSEDAESAKAVVIGASCPQPYKAASIINISGMSYGAISKPAVLALSMGAQKVGAWMNTGEGGLSPYHLEGGADIVFQIGTAKFGVCDEQGNLSDEKLIELAENSSIKMFEIKLSQGAKPGKGGILPGAKVNQEIATIRGINVGQDAISPNRHRDIASADQLLDMIDRVRGLTGKPVGFKTVIGEYSWLDELFAKINQRGKASAPDFITLDGADGGTGAAPTVLMDFVGLPLRESLPKLVDLLNQYQLRDQTKVICSGKLITPSGVAWALSIGADFVVSARGFMFALGCIQALQCNKNTCPTGITTHNRKLQRGLVSGDKAQRVANYINNIHYEVGLLAHSCGVKEPRALERRHTRVVVEQGKSIPLNELYPDII